MNVWGITDRGVIREQNQDAFAHQVLPDGRVLALVCDGMGGARAGNVASTMAVDIIMDEFLAEEEGARTLDSLKAAAALANRRIFQRAAGEESCAGMGTTLVAALADGEEALILNEGDSRAYHLSEEGGIVRVTRDHSLVEDLVQRAEPELRADVFRQPLAAGDYLLLCSDGLSNVVSEQELLYEVVHGGEACTCCRRLLEIALHRGAPDNVTAVLIQYE